MTYDISTSTPETCPTLKFPTKVKNRWLSSILKEVRAGNASEYCKRDALTYAVREGHLDALKYLLRNGADLLGVRDNVFRDAIVAGHLHIIKFLFEQNIYNDTHRKRTFEIALNRGYLEIIKHCVVERWVDLRNYDGNPMALASYDGRLDMVKFFVKQGADIHEDNEASLIAAAENGHFHIVQYLLQQGADIHAQNEGAFCGAVGKGHFFLALCLICWGSDIRKPKACLRLNMAREKSPEFGFLLRALAY